MFQNAFQPHNTGYAAAIATVLTLFISVVVAPALALLAGRRRDQPARPLTTCTCRALLARSRSYPIVSILFLAFHKKTTRHGLLAARRRSACTPSRAPGTEGNFGTGMWGSFPRRRHRHDRVGGPVAATGYAFGTMRFPARAALQPDRARPDLPLRGDGHPALLRLPGRAPERLVLDADPPADRPVGLPSARSGCAPSSSTTPRALLEAGQDRRGRHVRHPALDPLPDRAAGAAHAVRARLHVHLERVPAGARHAAGARASPPRRSA